MTDIVLFFKYLAVMAGVTYLIRLIPLLAVKKKIRNIYIKSFLYYVPYAVLGAMTFPAIFYSTGNVVPAIAGCIIALVLAWFEKGLLTVAVSAAAVVFASSILMQLF